jgi:hypothetical protein
MPYIYDTYWIHFVTIDVIRVLVVVKGSNSFFPEKISNFSPFGYIFHQRELVLAIFSEWSSNPKISVLPDLIYIRKNLPLLQATSNGCTYFTPG